LVSIPAWSCGEMRSGARCEQLALGEPPNLAARLEGLAVSRCS
jgi:hypothetical protein